MPLSEHEQRLFEQIERSLAEDPKFASAVRATDPRFHAKRRMIAAAVLLLAGMALLVYGVAISIPLLGVGGFVVMLGALVFGVQAYRRGRAPTCTPLAAPPLAAPGNAEPDWSTAWKNAGAAARGRRLTQPGCWGARRRWWSTRPHRSALTHPWARPSCPLRSARAGASGPFRRFRFVPAVRCSAPAHPPPFARRASGSGSARLPALVRSERFGLSAQLQAISHCSSLPRLQFASTEVAYDRPHRAASTHETSDRSEDVDGVLGDPAPRGRSRPPMWCMAPRLRSRLRIVPRGGAVLVAVLPKSLWQLIVAVPGGGSPLGASLVSVLGARWFRAASGRAGRVAWSRSVPWSR